jgi:hypothetical protein
LTGFLTASLPTQSKELLRHFFRQGMWHLPNFKHITSCLTWIDTIALNRIIKVLDKFEHVQKEKKEEKKREKKEKKKSKRKEKIR